MSTQEVGLSVYKDNDTEAAKEGGEQKAKTRATGWSKGPKQSLYTIQPPESNKTVLWEGSLSMIDHSPIEEQRFTLHKQTFRDALSLHYGWKPTRFPPHCSCGAPFTTTRQKLKSGTSHAAQLLTEVWHSACGGWATLPGQNQESLSHLLIMCLRRARSSSHMLLRVVSLINSPIDFVVSEGRIYIASHMTVHCIYNMYKIYNI